MRPPAPRLNILGVAYYGYRYYDPLTGRWPSRDPIGEAGGLNLYGFVLNQPLSNIDLLGQMLAPFGEVSAIPFFSVTFKDEEQFGKYLPDLQDIIAFNADDKNDPHATWRGKMCRVWVRGELKITFSKRKGMPDDQKGWDGRTIIAHERMHADIGKKYYDKLRDAIKWVDDTNDGYHAGSEEKAQAVMSVVNSAAVYYNRKGAAESALFDVTTYGTTHPTAKLSIEAKAAYEKYSGEAEVAKVALDAAQAALRKLK